MRRNISSEIKNIFSFYLSLFLLSMDSMGLIFYTGTPFFSDHNSLAWSDNTAQCLSANAKTTIQHRHYFNTRRKKENTGSSWFCWKKCCLLITLTERGIYRTLNSRSPSATCFTLMVTTLHTKPPTQNNTNTMYTQPKPLNNMSRAFSGGRAHTMRLCVWPSA